MICNVCGEDSRCYTLVEQEMRGITLRPKGLGFMICTNCLDKLIAPIKTAKTVIDDPVTANHASLKERLSIKPPEPEDPIKINYKDVIPVEGDIEIP